MTYEEALAKVLEVAGDYARISSTHDIEMTLYAQETAQLKNEIADIVKNLSLSPESIQLCVDGGEVAVEAFGKKVKAWRTVYESQLLKNAANDATRAQMKPMVTIPLIPAGRMFFTIMANAPSVS